MKTNNETMRKKIKKIISFTITPKRIKYLSKNAKILLDWKQFFKKLMREMEEDTNRNTSAFMDDKN